MVKQNIYSNLSKEELNRLRKTLRICGKDLRCTPLVRLYLEITEKIPTEIIDRAYKIYEEKFITEKEREGIKTLSFQYFKKVLETLSKGREIDEPLNWGKLI